MVHALAWHSDPNATKKKANGLTRQLVVVIAIDRHACVDDDGTAYVNRANVRFRSRACMDGQPWKLEKVSIRAYLYEAPSISYHRVKVRRWCTVSVY
jgi:hypothetical protein